MFLNLIIRVRVSPIIYTTMQIHIVVYFPRWWEYLLFLCLIGFGSTINMNDKYIYRWNFDFHCINLHQVFHPSHTILGLITVLLLCFYRMERKNESLPTIRGGGDFIPFHLAILQGRTEMAWHLFPKTKHIFEELDWTTLFFLSINCDLYGKHFFFI